MLMMLGSAASNSVENGHNGHRHEYQFTLLHSRISNQIDTLVSNRLVIPCTLIDKYIDVHGRAFYMIHACRAKSTVYLDISENAVNSVTQKIERPISHKCFQGQKPEIGKALWEASSRILYIARLCIGGTLQRVWKHAAVRQGLILQRSPRGPGQHGLAPRLLEDDLHCPHSCPRPLAHVPAGAALDVPRASVLYSRTNPGCIWLGVQIAGISISWGFPLSTLHIHALSETHNLRTDGAWIGLPSLNE